MTHEEILKTLSDYVDYLIAGSTAEAPLWNIEKVRSGKPNKWNYIDGCMITACLSLFKTTGNKKFLAFSRQFMDYFVKDGGIIDTYDPMEHNLDNINQGKNLFTLYDLTGERRYRDAIDTIRSQLDTQPRTKEGNFWHKEIYPWQVWLDGTYMAQPFYMEYETRYNKMMGCQDSYQQFMNIRKHMRDADTGLYYHGYDESRQMYWADPATGCSANFWLRAMGWFLVAMVDVLERMDEQMYYEYRAIMSMLQDAVKSMIQFQDEETGMFWQVIDKAGVPGNYLETSGTALFAYAVLKAVRLGYLPKRYAAYGEKAFYGTCDRYLGVSADGKLQLSGICLVAGLGGPQHRDGSLAYYFSEPVVENDAKGVGPLLLAYTEIIARK
ncbi:MAG: glycoside hydrolase family 88 protein [Gemmiger sp.]|uniref:glycoside hydrolase family 88/105 protein n=1 Tax=Gemmiger sp. TaxID=2049027 RepID=UPI002E76D234|nr:glycoside hydrolase family 88 protein [Gemmiger sp.]MEE0801903.1 glycoside hydrolase family 88 protein [Gemmiger sp.]